MNRFINWFALAAITCGLFASPAVTAALAAPIVLVDQYHDQRFLIEKEDPLQLSALATILKDDGWSVKSSPEPFTAELLNGVDAVIISGPFRAIELPEVEALLRFLERGGRLAVMLHVVRRHLA